MGSITLADLPVIQDAVAAYHPALVVIDPLQAYLGTKTDMYRANEVRPLLAELVLLAEQYDCAIVCVRHLSKHPQSRAIYRGLGSIDFAAAARSVLLVGEEPLAQSEGDEANVSTRSRRVLAQSKSSLAPTGPSLVFGLREGQFCWGGQSAITANALAAGLEPKVRRDAEVHRAEAWLRTYLRAGPRPAREGYAAAAALGIATRTLMRAKKAFGVHSKREGELWYWQAPCTPTNTDGILDTVDTLGTDGIVGTLSTLATEPLQMSQECQQCYKRQQEKVSENQQRHEECQECQECQAYQWHLRALGGTVLSGTRSLDSPAAGSGVLASCGLCPTPGCPGSLSLTSNKKAVFCKVCRYRAWVPL
jgi:hypothetical protein